MLIVQIIEYFVHVMMSIFHYNLIIAMQFHQLLSKKTHQFQKKKTQSNKYILEISSLILDVLFHLPVVVEYFLPENFQLNNIKLNELKYFTRIC